ncbi:hypothetical protein U1Q18_011121 [Sarracenia purpurea var. burkii]
MEGSTYEELAEDARLVEGFEKEYDEATGEDDEQDLGEEEGQRGVQRILTHKNPICRHHRPRIAYRFVRQHPRRRHDRRHLHRPHRHRPPPVRSLPPLVAAW